MRDRRHPHVVNVDEVDPAETRRGGRYAFSRRQIALAAGARALGASYMELPPGKAAWPFHFHCANEEGLFVIQGTGILRVGLDRVRLRSGDYVALPVGPDLAHQIINDSGSPLVYLAISTMVPTDVTVYPESDKIGVFAGAAPGGRKGDRLLDGFFRMEEAVDYWDREAIEDEDVVDVQPPDDDIDDE
jgi:uncharacterized cupin superfamily protein